VQHKYTFLYFLYQSADYIPSAYESKRTLRQPFQWNPPEESNDTETVKCKNSKQGRFLIVDQKGFVCKRDAVTNNCCNPKHSSSKQYSCFSCMKNGCCGLYEYCVSCCLQPKNQPLLSKILSRNLEAPYKLFASEVENTFELCLAKCRTSSQSVQHENSYRDANIKYCYGENPPDLQTTGV